jgi:hypothetical protein
VNAGATVSLLTYIWHYLFARMIYDQLLRPLIHGDASGVLLVGCVAAIAFFVGRASGRRASLRGSARRVSRRRA